MRPTRCQLRHRSDNTVDGPALATAAAQKAAAKKKGIPTVGLEPTTTRLRVLRSTN